MCVRHLDQPPLPTSCDISSGNARVPCNASTPAQDLYPHMWPRSHQPGGVLDGEGEGGVGNPGTGFKGGRVRERE